MEIPIEKTLFCLGGVWYEWGKGFFPLKQHRLFEFIWFLVGGLEHGLFPFHIWDVILSNWRSHIFQRGTWWLIPLSKWVITPVISGLTLLIPFITGVITHLLSGMSHQVGIPPNSFFSFSPVEIPNIHHLRWWWAHPRVFFRWGPGAGPPSG